MRAVAIARLQLAPAKPAAPAKPPAGGPSFASHLRGVDKPDDAPAETKPEADKPPAEQLALQLASVAPTIVPMLVEALQHATAKPAAPAPAAPEQIAAQIAPALAIADVAPAKPEPPLTPLEQAVHDLLDQLDKAAPHADAPPTAQALFGHALITATMDPPPERAPSEIAAPAIHAAAEPTPPPEATNPSHVHLVVDDGASRVVVTVAVRGEEVRVQMRSNDDSIATDLARNAGVLDHALRARGLDLHDFTAQRDPESRDRDQPQRDQRRETERFTLEEKP